MALANYQVWPFSANWSEPFTESLAWLSDVLVSPTGSEQRRTLRYFPRQSVEFQVAIYGEERSFYDNLVVSHGARHWYAPLWYDVHFLKVNAAIGASIVFCDTADQGELRVDGPMLLMGDSPFNYELVEIQAITSTGVALKSPLTKSWPLGTRLFPVGIARLSAQPETTKHNDKLATAEIKFEIVEATPDSTPLISDIGLTDTYLNFKVLSYAPDERENLTSASDRNLVELDNQTSMPIWQDISMRTFTKEDFSWFINGRAELRRMKALLQYLRGRVTPIWVPTFKEDFRLRTRVVAGNNSIQVERAGFTLSGGPRPDRQDIMIELISGQKIYRRITASAITTTGQETLALNSPIGVNIELNNVLRICFMTLMRLNQDTVEISHETDSAGIASVTTTFRSAPDSRVPITANL